MTSWAYCVTTVPKRRRTTLPRTLQSLADAGFSRPHLFVDGEHDSKSWYDEFGLDVTARYPAVRIFGNWALALAEMYVLQPHADRYAVFQDDAVFCRGLRKYLEGCDLHEQSYWNLYTWPDNHGLVKDKPPGWHPSNQWGRGALALVLPHPLVLKLLQHENMALRPLNPDKGWRNVDGGIITAAKKMGCTELVHHPSLCQHIGQVSTKPGTNYPISPSFIGEDVDVCSVMQSSRR